MPQANLGSIPRTRRRSPGLPQLADAGDRQQTLLAGLLLAVGSIWMAVPLLDFMTGTPLPFPGLGAVGVAVLLAVGAGQVLWGLDLLLYRKTLTIDHHTVRVSVRGLWSVRRWSEPLANYHGLRHRRERVRHRYGWRIVHRLQLAHRDPAKEIDLLRTRGEPRIAAARRQWSEWLDLPIWSGDVAASRRWADEPERRAVGPNGIASF